VTLMIPRVALNPDAFLYACHTADTARHRKNGTFHSHLRYEPFLMDSFKRPAGPDVKRLRTEITAILKHHFQVSPQFRRNEDVDLETISYFTLAISTLFADLASLFRGYAGVDLPRIPSHDTEYSDGFPQLARVITAYSTWLKNADAEKEAFDPFAVDETSSLAELQNQQAEFAAEIWDLISEQIFSVFPDHAPAIMSFASWKFKLEEPVEEIDWRVRPPVGDLFAKAFRMRSSPRAGATRGGDRGRGNDRGRGPAGPGGPSGTNDRGAPRGGPRGERPLRGSDHDRPEVDGGGAPDRNTDRVELRPAPVLDGRPERADRGPRPDRGDRPDRGGDRGGSRGPRTDRGDRGASGRGTEGFITNDEDLEPWLNEAREAIAALQADPDLEEVALRASNSYIRRQQHTVIVDLGYASESRGEGRERAIFVKQRS